MYICIDNMELEKVPHCLVKSSLVFVLVEGGCLAALFLYSNARQGRILNGHYQNIIMKYFYVFNTPIIS